MFIYQDTVNDSGDLLVPNTPSHGSVKVTIKNIGSSTVAYLAGTSNAPASPSNGYPLDTNKEVTLVLNHDDINSGGTASGQVKFGTASGETSRIAIRVEYN